MDSNRVKAGLLACLFLFFASCRAETTPYQTTVYVTGAEDRSNETETGAGVSVTEIRTDSTTTSKEETSNSTVAGVETTSKTDVTTQAASTARQASVTAKIPTKMGEASSQSLQSTYQNAASSKSTDTTEHPAVTIGTTAGIACFFNWVAPGSTCYIVYGGAGLLVIILLVAICLLAARLSKLARRLRSLEISEHNGVVELKELKKDAQSPATSPVRYDTVAPDTDLEEARSIEDSFDHSLDYGASSPEAQLETNMASFRPPGEEWPAPLEEPDDQDQVDGIPPPPVFAVSASFEPPAPVEDPDVAVMESAEEVEHGEEEEFALSPQQNHELDDMFSNFMELANADNLDQPDDFPVPPPPDQ